jgi:tetratricopeptide (TPR) repeat protein
MLNGELVNALTSSRIIPGGDRPWSEQQRWVVEAGSNLLELGLDSETIARLARMAWTLAALEVDVAVHQVGAGISAEQAFDFGRQRRRAISRLIAAVRHGAMAKTMDRFMGIGDSFHHFANSGQHVPSTAFSARYAMADHLTAALDRADQSSNPETCLAAARLLLYAGRRKEALAVIQPMVDQGLHGKSLAFHGALCAALGDLGNAWESAGLALQANPESAFVLVCNALVRACQAGSADDIIIATSAVGETLRLLDKSHHASCDTPLEALETQLLRGRLYLLMPQAFKVANKGIADLKAVMQGTGEAHSPEQSGVAAILRLRALFDMAQAMAAQPGKAVELYRRAIIIDPACTLAEKAYRRISDLARPPKNG